MAFWGKIFKKERNTRADKDARNVGVLNEVLKTSDKKVVQSELAKRSGSPNFITGVILAPHITEKANSASGGGKYVFLASTKSNKSAVKRAVEARYGVDVEAINIVNVPGKERRRGRQIGWRPGFKKAIVKIKEGQSIEIQ